MRVVLFSARLGGLATRRAPTTTATPQKPAVRISLCTSHASPREASWTELTQHLVDRSAEEWFHASGFDASHVEEIARHAGIAPTFLAQTLQETAYPRVEVHHRFSALFAWIPTLGPGEDGLVERNGVLLLATEQGVLTIEQRAIGLRTRSRPR